MRNWIPLDESVRWPDDHVFWSDGMAGCDWNPIWYQDADLRKGVNALQAYDRGIKRIISHEDWTPASDFCASCDSYATIDGLCDACNYHKPKSIQVICEWCGYIVPDRPSNFDLLYLHYHTDPNCPHFGYDDHEMPKQKKKPKPKPLFKCAYCGDAMANPYFGELCETCEPRKGKAKPVVTLKAIIFEFLDSIAIYISERLL